jgi:hypothetical protein
MATTYADVVVFTRYHSFSGRVTLRDQRLSDMMNDRRETVMQVANAAIARLSAPSKVVNQHKVAVLGKEHVALIFEVAEQPTASLKRPYAFTLKQAFDVFLVLESLEVRGVMHTTGNFDVLELHRLVAVSGDKFMPVTDATVTLPGMDFQKRSGVLVNVNHIHSISKYEA